MSTNTPELPFFAPSVAGFPKLNSGLIVFKCLLAGYKTDVSDQKLLSMPYGEVQDSYLEHSAKTAPLFASVDLLAETGRKLGFTIGPQVLPTDYAFSDQATYPSLIAMQPIPEEPAYWVVIWRRVGPFYQIYDPKLGHRWLTRSNLLAEVYRETVPITVEQWQTLSQLNSFKDALHHRLTGLGLSVVDVKTFLKTAESDKDAYPLVTLDAATRMVSHLVQEKSIDKGEEAKQLLETLSDQTLRPLRGQSPVIPAQHWVVSVNEDRTATNLPLKFEGLVRLQIEGYDPVADLNAIEDAPRETDSIDTTTWLPRTLIQYLRTEGSWSLLIIGISLVFAAASVFVQAILLRGLMTLGLDLVTLEQRIWAIGLILTFSVTLLGLQWFSLKSVLTLGHQLEARLRMAILAVIPDLSSQTFQHISAADLIERINSLRVVRQFPFYVSEFVHYICQFGFTILGLFLIDWVVALIALLRMTLSLVLIGAGRSLNAENLRTRTYLGALSRFSLDSMRGLQTIRTHSAEQSTRRAYRDMLRQWHQAQWLEYRKEIWLDAGMKVLSHVLIALIIVIYALRGGNPVNWLLLFYWSFNLDRLGKQLMLLSFVYYRDQSKVDRFLQLFKTPREADLFNNTDDEVDAVQDSLSASPAVAIDLQKVTVKLESETIFNEIDLQIDAGSQVAIVGPSGAGKSTLVGLLLGWYQPVSGQILIDQQPLTYSYLQQLRQHIAWVDPTVQLWNRSFLYNVRYNNQEQKQALNLIINQADLRDLLERLPEGMQTSLGGEGQFVSGGEGQRIRLARAMQRKQARLVILDEPFRGLDREKRRELLEKARHYWSEATILCVTHDVGQTTDFERILMMDQGRIIEDGAPQTLLDQTDSRYRQMLEAEESVREKMWAGDHWRHIWLENGQLVELSKK